MGTTIASFLLLLALTSSVLASEEELSSSANTQAASEQLISVLAERGAQLHEVSGRFTQTKRIVGLPIELKSNGKFHFLAKQGMQWHTLSPIDSLVNISAEGISNGNASAGAQPALLGQLVLAVFSGDLTALQRFFSITASGETDNWSIQLSPVQATVEQQFSVINVSGTEFTELVQLLEKNGDETVITLKAESLKNHND